MMNVVQLARFDLNLLVVFEVLMDTRSVTLTGARLGRTPSAISHALNRMRDQLGDPLMVKVGGRMQPSPFALDLIEEVRPILRGIGRVISPPEAFDPATSDRVFRIAMPTIPRLIAAVSNRIAAKAPGVRVEWMPAHHPAYPALRDGLIDLAHLGGTQHLPDGLEQAAAPPFTWTTFLREGHPALADWGVAAWQHWPHLMVNVSRSVENPFLEEPGPDGIARRIGALIADSSGVAAVLAQTDFLGTFPPLLLAWDIGTRGLVARRPPVALPPVPVRFLWSARLASDPGSRWLRSIVMSSYAAVQSEAEARVASVTGA